MSLLFKNIFTNEVKPVEHQLVSWTLLVQIGQILFIFKFSFFAHVMDAYEMTSLYCETNLSVCVCV